MKDISLRHIAIGYNKMIYEKSLRDMRALQLKIIHLNLRITNVFNLSVIVECFFGVKMRC